MPASAYFTEAGLRALIRNPAAVRGWPAQQMPAFDAATIRDSDIDAFIVYLQHGLSSFPSGGLTHRQHGTGIEAAVAQCSESFRRPVECENLSRVRLQLALLIESEDLADLRRDERSQRL
jgi:hypothetical protein